jgi:hypothetical protein
VEWIVACANSLRQSSDHRKEMKHFNFHYKGVPLSVSLSLKTFRASIAGQPDPDSGGVFASSSEKGKRTGSSR